MGKTTLIHPIPLSVIRGAAEYCGWKFSRLVQKVCEPDLGRARYVAEIAIMPERLTAQGYQAMHDDLQSCFMDDIRIAFLHKTRRDKYLVELQIDLGNRADVQDGTARKREIPL